MAKKKDKYHPAHKNIPIIGIGASAGGLEAYEAFFKKMPSDTGMAFVAVSHLDPTQISILPDLLSKQTQMKVVPIVDGIQIEPDHVYVIPPNKDLNIINGSLFLMELSQPRGLNLPIDNFFRSLAQDQGSSAICVILSGTGSDGTLGLKEIKAGLGMAMVQDEKSAQYDGMPRNAVATGLVDYVLPVEKMPEQILKYVKSAKTIQTATQKADSDIYKKALNKIFILLRSQTNHDFSNYKKNTIDRRIERRMTVHQIEKINDYVTFLGKSEKEVHVLFKDLLIGVTSFFRDSEAFENLQTDFLQNLLKNKSDNAKVRIWVPGCSTGEEAYSIAIMIQECMEQLGRHFDVQIFGTDIDEEAIETARSGIYPLSISADIIPQRLNRYFIKEETNYKVKKTIREMLVFAPQNLIKDPPFTKLDLLSCRNLLIYLGPELQKRVLPIFHYSLNTDGFLFLGSSESIGQSRDLFTIKDKKWKIFKRQASSSVAHPVLNFPDQPSDEDPGKVGDSKAVQKTKDVDNLKLVETILEQSETPPCAIIDEKNNIVYIHGRTGKYLEPAVGRISVNILEMARPGLKGPLAACIRKAASQNFEVTQNGIEIRENGSFALVDILVKPMQEWGAMRGFAMVAFKETPSSKKQTKPKKPLKNKELVNLEQELQYTKENLQTTIEELETSNEELKSTNEELQSTNEELQSTNEELETSKEELQSLNEESTTVNAELQSRIDELSKTTDDMKNLLDSTKIATIFLDIDLCVRRFTPMVTDLIPLGNSDIGRPISHFATQLKQVKLTDYAAKVLKDLAMRENIVETLDNRIFKIRTLPYRTIQNVIDGVVITFEDITRQKQAEHSLTTNEEMLRMIIESGEDVIALTKLDGTYLHYSGPRNFGLIPEKVVGQNICDILDKKTSKMVLKEFNEVAVSKKGKYFETSFIWQGKKVYYEDFRYPVFDNEGNVFAVGTIGRNITKRKEAEKLLQKNENRYKIALKELPIIVAHFDCDLRYTWIHNPHPDFDLQESLGKRDDEIIQNQSTTELMLMKEQVINTGKKMRKTITFPVSDKDHTYDIAIQPIIDSKGNITGATSAAFDITDQVKKK